jgi:hypothetical protein
LRPGTDNPADRLPDPPDELVAVRVDVVVDRRLEPATSASTGTTKTGA